MKLLLKIWFQPLKYISIKWIFLGNTYLDGSSNKSTLQSEVLASWKRRRTSDNDTIVENDAAKRSVDETVETTVNESCATGVTSSEYHQQDDDITNEFASSQGNSQEGFFFKKGGGSTRHV